MVRLKRWSTKGTLPIGSAMNCFNGTSSRFRRYRQPVEKHQGLELVTSAGAEGRSCGYFLGKRLITTANAALADLAAAAAPANGLRLDAVTSCDTSHRYRLKQHRHCQTGCQQAKHRNTNWTARAAHGIILKRLCDPQKLNI